MFKKLRWFFLAEKASYVIAIITLLSLSVVTAIIPLIIGQVIDGMTEGTFTHMDLMIWVVVLFIFAFAQYGMRYLWRVKLFGTSTKLEEILRRRLFHHFTKMDTVFFQKYRTGDLMARATNDLNAIRMVAGSGILTLVDSLAQGLLTLAMMLWAVDWRLTLVSIIPIPLLAVMIRYVGQKLHLYSNQAQKAFSSMNDKVQESISGMKVIKTFGEEELDIEDFQKMTDKVVGKNRKVYQYDAIFRPSADLIMGAATIIGIFYGGQLVSRGQISIGMLVAFISYIARLSWPMFAVGQLFNILERGSASYDRIEEILAEDSLIVEAPDASNQSIAGDITIAIDRFAYPDEDEAILEDVYIHIQQGQTLGIVGRTGSAKTTLFKLLLRDFDDYQGDIRYNGVSIRDYSLDSLLANIGYVPQDNFLFSTTVRDNIRFGKMTASEEEVVAITKTTSVHEDILGFTEGYDTLVGERGVALSGGQKQRIAMARAMLINPELLILDDSLSAVDAKTEEKILAAIKATRSDKTTIISAHRISSVMHADEIVVLEHGRIVERGTHSELVAQDGWYKEMYERQQLSNTVEGVTQDGRSE